MSKNSAKNVAGKDVFERMNYLYQLCNIMLKGNDNNTASSLYSNLLINVSKKAVQRMEPDMKRSICKKCNNFLISGMTAKVRIKKKTVRWICNRCQNTKVFKAVPGYQVWLENKDAVVESIKY